MKSEKGFKDVMAGQQMSAMNVNALHAAVRELQSGTSDYTNVNAELARLDLADVPASRPVRNDGVIGTVVVSEGTTTNQYVEIATGNVRKVKELNVSIKRKFDNVGQKFFSRDEVFSLVPLDGSFVPFKLGGAEAVICRTTTSIAAAATWDAPAFGTVNAVDWNEAGTKLVATGSTLRVANLATGASGSIAANRTIVAVLFGKVYVIIYELCV